MKKIAIVAMTLLMSMGAIAQTKTTEALHKKYSGALSAFFYHNTLRMLNQNDDPALDELIKDIEKMKFLMVDKAKTFGKAEYKKLTADYKTEKFEEIMSSRYQGKNFDVLLKEVDGKTKGMIVLINDSTSLYVLDIVGSIALNKVTSLYSTLNGSADFGAKIREFTNRKDEKTKRDDDEDE